MCSGIRMYLILHLISFLYRLITYNESVFTAILLIVPKGIMTIVLSGISNFSPIHVDDHRDEKNCILYLKKWLACQLSRLIIFFYIEGFPAWVNFLLQLTRKLSYETKFQPGSRRSPEEGNGYPLQYSCLKNSTDRGTWRTSVHGVVKNQTWLSG